MIQQKSGILRGAMADTDGPTSGPGKPAVTRCFPELPKDLLSDNTGSLSKLWFCSGEGKARGRRIGGSTSYDEVALHVEMRRLASIALRPDDCTQRPAI